MPLDPQLQAMRDQRERDNVPPLYAMSLTEARAADLASIRASGGEPEHVHEVANLKIPGPGGELPLRLYRPAGERPLPALLYFFGGGWVLGTIDTADGVSRSLANSSGALVVVVGYRLAPEHPFPAAIDDCYATVRWAAPGARHPRRVRPAARSGRGVRPPAGRRRRPGRTQPLPGHGARVLHDGRHRWRQPGRDRAGRGAVAGMVRYRGRTAGAAQV